MTVTIGKVADLTEARTLALPPGSIVVFDRGYTDYAWYNKLDNQGISFVTRLKRHALITDKTKPAGQEFYRYVEECSTDPTLGRDVHLSDARVY